MIYLSFIQERKAQAPIEVTLLGISIDVSFVHSLNA